MKRRAVSTGCLLLSPLGWSLPGSKAKPVWMLSCSLRSVPWTPGKVYKSEASPVGRDPWLSGFSQPSMRLAPHGTYEAQLPWQPSKAGHVPSHSHTPRLSPSGGGSLAEKGSPLALQQVMESKVTGLYSRLPSSERRKGPQDLLGSDSSVTDMIKARSRAGPLSKGAWRGLCSRWHLRQEGLRTTCAGGCERAASATPARTPQFPRWHTATSLSAARSSCREAGPDG